MTLPGTLVRPLISSKTLFKALVRGEVKSRALDENVSAFQ